MWSLLQWLYDRAGRVFEFLGTLYWQIRNAAVNAWNWARRAASDAFQWSLNKILYYYGQAVTAAKNLVSIVEYEFWKALAQASTAARDLIKSVEYEFWKGLNTASIAARDLIKITEYNLFKSLNEASIASQNLIKITEYKVFKTLNEASIASNMLIEGLSTKVAQIKSSLGLDVPENVKAFTTFLNNPIGWFAAYLMSILLVTLEYSLANALGTENAILPPGPDFGIAGAGGPIPTGPGPPPGSSPLAPPLDTLYLSGYRFGPGHPGSDFGCTPSSVLYACHGGKVIVAGWSNVGYGNYVIIQGNEWWSLYGHLSQIGVRVGQDVSMRQSIGLCGCTGNSTCNHLHLELKHYGKYVDPVLVFGA